MGFVRKKGMGREAEDNNNKRFVVRKDLKSSEEFLEDILRDNWSSWNGKSVKGKSRYEAVKKALKKVINYLKKVLEWLHWLQLIWWLLKELGLLVIQKPSKRSLFDIA